jgi:hypothetical protein
VKKAFQVLRGGLVAFSKLIARKIDRVPLRAA